LGSTVIAPTVDARNLTRKPRKLKTKLARLSISGFCTQGDVKMRFNDVKMTMCVFRRDVMRFDHLKC
jgi:hypothetical protein